MAIEPTKVNTGSSRPVTTTNVINAENRGVEREQLNRILSSLDSRISVVESGSGNGGGSTGDITISSDATQINVVQTSNNYDLSLTTGGVTTPILADDAVTTAKILDANVTVQKIEPLTVSRAVVTDGAGLLDVSATTATEIGYINGLEAALQPQLDTLYYAESTGLFFGGVLSINADPTKFDVSAGAGMIVDYWTNPTDPPVVYNVTWSAFTAQTVTNLATDPVTFVLMDRTGAIVQQTTDPTPADKREYILLGQLGHSNLTTINNVVNSPSPAESPLGQLRDITDKIGVISEGNIVSANGANLSINISAGSLTKLGSNFHTDPKTPSTVSFSAKTPATIRRRTQTGNGATGVTTLDPGNWDVGGTITALVGTKFTNQYVYLLTSGNVVVQYGQYEYNSLANAVAGVRSEVFTVLENLEENAVLIGIVSVRSSATNLSDSSQAAFLRVSRFGETVGSAAGVSISTLQNVYNNSTDPEILTDSTRGALTLRRGSAADTDNVLEIQNGAGSTTARITGAGQIVGAGINSTPIGATTPSTGAFTTLTTTSTATIGGNTSITGALTTTGNAGFGGSPSYRLDVIGTSGTYPTSQIRHSAADVEGEWLRIARTDAPTIRYHSFKAFHTGAAASNYVSVFVHNGSSTTAQSEVMRWRGDGQVSIPGTLSVSSTISASNLAGTTYTPTLGGTVSVNVSSSTLQTARYTRVGNVVDVTAVFFVTPTAGSTSTRISVTLPVASNFSTVYQCAGGCFHRETAFLSGGVFGDSTNDNAVVEFTSQSTSLHEVVAKFSYQVI